ncbi:MAG: radical SAM protein [Acidobacteriota bacterium]|nr:radical SAM protein [Acidobacteriota bacterium]
MKTEDCTGKAVELSETESVCPQCLSRIAARRVARGDDIYLEKQCPEHGEFKTILWRGLETYRQWESAKIVPSCPPSCQPSSGLGCPYDCGLCEEHRQHTCCVILEVTQRCNLRCPVCFARSGAESRTDEPGLEDIRRWCRRLLEKGGPYNVQLSGGEPTVRDDVPEIVRLVRSEGFEFVQLNTNGLRLGEDKEYARQLKDAGLGCVFLQFDGVTAEAHRSIRGRDLRAKKLKAIRNCSTCGLGVVLVPTLVPGVNTGEIGAILELALHYAPTVRAVHFQPVSYFGRYPSEPRNEDRITLPEIMRAIELQTGGLFRACDLYPASGENAFCEFHGKFLVHSDGRVDSCGRPKNSCCAPPVDAGLVQLGAVPDGNGEGARRARNFVARHWAMPEEPEECSPGLDLNSMDAFLAEHRQTFCISAMAFQDAWNLDLRRLKECFLHVLSPDENLVPLCAYNLTAAGGQSLYRGCGTASPALEGKP